MAKVKRQPRVTAAMVADACGVSRTTVSFVLNGRDMGINPDTRTRVLRTAVSMGLLPKGDARRAGWLKVAYATRRIEHFNSFTSFFANVYSHLNLIAPARRLELSLVELRLEDLETCYLRAGEMKALGVEVVVASDVDIHDFALGLGFKAVLTQPGSKPRDGVFCVRCDDLLAGRLAAAHLLELGHRRAALVFPESLLDHDRRGGFLEAFGEGGGRIAEWLPEQLPWDGAEIAAAVAAAVAAAAREPLEADSPSALFCFADNLVFPTIRGLWQAGLVVPRDMSVIGADNLFWGAQAAPAFSTIDLNEEMFAAKLADAVVDAFHDTPPYDIKIPARLLARESTGTPRSA